MYHTIDICLDLAEKLRSPHRLHEFIFEENQDNQLLASSWSNLSLASGFPGIACYYGALDHIFPDQKWGDIAHDYFKFALSKCEEEEKHENYSLYYGLSGFSYAIYLCSKKGSRYQRLLDDLDALLLKSIERNLLNFKLLGTHNLSIQHYNLMHGLSGVLAYLLLRKENAIFRRLAKECTHCLVSMLSTPKSFTDFVVPGWYISPEYQSYHGIKFDSQGGFSLTMPHGVLGCLSVLSLAAWDGITTPDLHQTIEMLTTWVVQRGINTSQGTDWPHYFSLKKEDEEQLRVYEKSWFSGTPAAALSLYLSGRSLNDKTLMKRAEDHLTKDLLQEDDWSLTDLSFSNGKAGVLAMMYHSAKMTNNGLLMQHASHLQKKLANLYNPSHRYGFQIVKQYASGECSKYHDPTLLDGSIGICLALLLAEGRIDDYFWDRAFLLR